MKAGWVAGLIIVAAVMPAQAMITGASMQADTDGALDMKVVTDTAGFAGGVVGFQSTITQYRSLGHALGSVQTDTEDDPTAVSNNTVLNDTGFTWTGYTVNIYMNKSFSINAGATTGPAGWNWTVVPVAGGSFLDLDGNPWSYRGTVNYTSTGPAFDIPVNSSGSFGVTFSWLGSTLYLLELIPVPEPMSLALLALGGMFLRRRGR